MAGELAAVGRDIGERVARRFADDVDRDARFPIETMNEVRRSGLLAAFVPSSLGGVGASTHDVAAAVAAISEFCASSGLILAMHEIQVAYVVRHASAPAIETLASQLVAGEMLLASANSEVGLGGDRRRSMCALEPAEGGYRLEKEASTVSYGEFADGVVATARRSPQSAPNDQVLAICLAPSLILKQTGEWDTLGMRGTCSKPARLEAEIGKEFVIEDYASAFVRTSLPISAVLLSSVWLGISEGAAKRAHDAVRAQARKSRGEGKDVGTPPGAIRLAELVVQLHQLREIVRGAATEFDRVKDTNEVEEFAFTSRMDTLKISASTLVVDIVLRAMAICGLPGYQNDSAFSVARHLRDATSAPLMVNNDRALFAHAQALLVNKEL